MSAFQRKSEIGGAAGDSIGRSESATHRRGNLFLPVEWGKDVAGKNGRRTLPDHALPQALLREPPARRRDGARRRRLEAALERKRSERLVRVDRQAARERGGRRSREGREGQLHAA